MRVRHGQVGAPYIDYATGLNGVRARAQCAAFARAMVRSMRVSSLKRVVFVGLCGSIGAQKGGEDGHSLPRGCDHAVRLLPYDTTQAQFLFA